MTHFYLEMLYYSLLSGEITVHILETSRCVPLFCFEKVKTNELKSFIPLKVLHLHRCSSSAGRLMKQETNITMTQRNLGEIWGCN